jgi:hypothetical protein
MNSEIVSNADLVLPMNMEAKIILEKYLTTGETLKWSDKPQMRWKQDLKRFTPVLGFFLILFIFILSNFLFQSTNRHRSQELGKESAQQEQDSPHKEEKPPLVGIIFISAFVAAFFSFWCYMMFRGLGGQKLLDLLSLSKTYYGLTDYRLIMVSGRKEFRVLSYHLRSVQDLRLREEPDGVGTINLGSKDRCNNPFQTEDSPPLILKNIPQAAHVFNLIFKAQDKLLRQ